MNGTSQQLLIALKPLGEYLERGEQIRYNCPQCEKAGSPVDKHNLECNFSRNSYHCWACNDSGNVFKLVNKYGYKEYANLFKSERDELADKLKSTVASKILEIPPHTISVLKSNVAKDYLLNTRGLALEKVREREIKYCFEGFYKNCIIFPSYNLEGRLNYFTTHNLTTLKYWKCKAPANICFYESYTDRRIPIVLTEGVYDALCIPNAIPLLGLKVTPATGNFLADTTVILALDSFVEAKAKSELIKQLRNVCLSVSEYQIPNNYKDVNEIFLKNKQRLTVDLKQLYQEI